MILMHRQFCLMPWLPFLSVYFSLPSSIIAPPIKTKLIIKNGIATRPTTATKPARANPLANDNSEVPIKSNVLAPLLIVFDSLPSFSNVGTSLLTAIINNSTPIIPIGKSKVALTKFFANVPIESDIILKLSAAFFTFLPQTVS